MSSAPTKRARRTTTLDDHDGNSSVSPGEEEVVDEEGVIWIRDRYTDEYRLKKASLSALLSAILCCTLAQSKSFCRGVTRRARNLWRCLPRGTSMPLSGRRRQACDPIWPAVVGAPSRSTRRHRLPVRPLRQRAFRRAASRGNGSSWKRTKPKMCTTGSSFRAKMTVFAAVSALQACSLQCKLDTSADARILFSRQPTRGTAEAECISSGR